MVVYTCITNQKDLRVNMVKEEGVDYICFSDKPFTHPLWQYRPVENLGINDPRRIARRYKILSHIYFPGQKTIWLDGRVVLKVQPSELFRLYDADIAARPHPSRTCIYDEGDVIKRQDYDDHVVVDNHMDYLKSMAFPAGIGLHETGCLLRRANRNVVSFNERWWSVLAAFSKRDQLSFDFVRWHTRTHVDDIDRKYCHVLAHHVKTNREL